WSRNQSERELGDERSFPGHGSRSRASRFLGEHSRAAYRQHRESASAQARSTLIASIEERVFVEDPQRRVPDVWIQGVSDSDEASRVAESGPDTAVIIEVEDLEIHETRVEILDAYRAMKLVALIEDVSPTNSRQRSPAHHLQLPSRSRASSTRRVERA